MILADSDEGLLEANLLEDATSDNVALNLRIKFFLCIFDVVVMCWYWYWCCCCCVIVIVGGGGGGGCGGGCSVCGGCGV